MFKVMIKLFSGFLNILLNNYIEQCFTQLIFKYLVIYLQSLASKKKYTKMLGQRIFNSKPQLSRIKMHRLTHISVWI